MPPTSAQKRDPSHFRRSHLLRYCLGADLPNAQVLTFPLLERVSALSIQGVVQNAFTKIGSTLMECGIEDLRFISAENYQDIPRILEQW